MVLKKRPLILLNLIKPLKEEIYLMGMNSLSIEALFQASFNVFNLSFLILWILALGECRKERGGKCLMYLSLILFGLILQLGKPFYSIYHTLRHEGLGRFELLSQNLWIINWYVFVACFLLGTGLIYLFVRNGIKLYYKTCLPIAVATLVCFAYTTTLLITGSNQ